MTETVIVGAVCTAIGKFGGVLARLAAGASGCRARVTLFQEMVRRGANMRLASLCIGGGMVAAFAVEPRSAARHLG
jgi:acetyl-CoA acetyltransferase